MGRAWQTHCNKLFQNYSEQSKKSITKMALAVSFVQGPVRPTFAPALLSAPAALLPLVCVVRG